jgi:hypothetical protein
MRRRRCHAPYDESGSSCPSPLLLIDQPGKWCKRNAPRLSTALPRRGDLEMEWVLLVSLQWIVSGSPTPPTTTEIQSFASEELCNKAAEAIRNELNAPLAANPRAQTLGRVVCVKRRDN